MCDNEQCDALRYRRWARLNFVENNIEYDFSWRRANALCGLEITEVLAVQFAG